MIKGIALENTIDEPDLLSAEQVLINIINKGLQTIFTNSRVFYVRDDGLCLFQQDFKNETLWCYYDEVWQIFETKYSMNYEQIKSLQKRIIGKRLYCKEFTPSEQTILFKERTGEGLDCEDFLPMRFYNKMVFNRLK